MESCMLCTNSLPGRVVFSYPASLPVDWWKDDGINEVRISYLFREFWSFWRPDPGTWIVQICHCSAMESPSISALTPTHTPFLSVSVTVYPAPLIIFRDDERDMGHAR